MVTKKSIGQSSYLYSITAPLGCCNIGIPSKINIILTKYRSSITPVSILQSAWNFAQSMAASLSFSVQNVKTIEQLRQMLWMNEISQDLSLGWISVGYRLLEQRIGFMCLVTPIWTTIDGRWNWEITNKLRPHAKVKISGCLTHIATEITQVHGGVRLMHNGDELGWRLTGACTAPGELAHQWQKYDDVMKWNAFRVTGHL